MSIYTLYAEMCKRIVNNDELFKTFKSHPHFSYMLEHQDAGIKELGDQYCELIINQYRDVLPSLPWDKFRENDSRGNPVVHYRKQLNRDFSFTTLRYIYISLGIVKFLRERSDLHALQTFGILKIVEIGGGYGGLCKILTDLLESININCSYTMIDIPTVLQLQEKYTSVLNVHADMNFLSCYEYEKEHTKYDLVLSTYSLGELDVHLQDDYIEKLLPRCKLGYILWNTPIVNENLYNNHDVRVTPEGLVSIFNNKILMLEKDTTK